LVHNCIVFLFCSHRSNSLVGGFDCDRFDFAYRDAIDSSGFVNSSGCKNLLCSFLLLFKCVKPSLLSLVETIFLALCFAETNMGVNDVDCCVCLNQLVFNPLQLVLPHFLCNSVAQVLWAIFKFFSSLLFLHFHEFIFDSKLNYGNFTYVRPVRIVYNFFKSV